MPAIFFFLISEKWKIKKNEKTPWRYWKISVIRNAWYLVFTCGLVMDKSVGGLTGTFRTSFMDINLNLSFPSQRQFYNWPISYRLWKGFVRKLKKKKQLSDVFSPVQSLSAEWKSKQLSYLWIFGWEISVAASDSSVQ